MKSQRIQNGKWRKVSIFDLTNIRRRRRRNACQFFLVLEKEAESFFFGVPRLARIVGSPLVSDQKKRCSRKFFFPRNVFEYSCSSFLFFICVGQV